MCISLSFQNDDTLIIDVILNAKGRNVMNRGKMSRSQLTESGVGQI